MRPRNRFAWLLFGALIAAAVLIGALGAAAQQTDPPPSSSTAAGSFDQQLATDNAIAVANGLTLDIVPQELGRPLTIEDLPDLIPVVDGDGAIIGYARAEEAFIELFDPALESIAFGIYDPDGQTLRGHEIPEQGFVPGTHPLQTSRPARIPNGDSPLNE
jgi:hypothetical protein